MAKNYVLKTFGPISKRREYSKTINNLPLKNLVQIQKKSYRNFLKNGITEVFENIFPINSTNRRIRIEFLPKTLRIEKPEDEHKELKEAKIKGKTYGAKIYAELRKIDEELGEVKQQEVFFGEMPLMTKGASFVVNGSEKVIVSQLLRAPGAYFGLNVRTSRTGLYNRVEIIPNLGTWIDIYHKVDNPNATDFVKVSIDKNKPISISVFLRAFGIPKTAIQNMFGNIPLVQESIKKDNKPTEDDALNFVHSIIRRGDRITEESRSNLFSNLMFNKRRYNLSKTGRFMLNRKLSVTQRITNTFLAKNLVDIDGKILYSAGLKIDQNIAMKIHQDFLDKKIPLTPIEGIDEKVYGLVVKPKDEGGKLTPEQISLKNMLYIAFLEIYPNLKWKEEGKEPLKIIGNDVGATQNHLVMPDIIATISYYFNLAYGLGNEDDPDSLLNKRVVSIGELLKNQLQIAITKLEKNAKERMSAKEAEKITPKNVTNNKPIYDQFKAFFNTSQLSQFMDQTNPLAELSNKRRVTSLGPGGLNRETASHEVRDVHTTHYGRICPIETPEGQNIGLILNFANYARINDYGFIETPYFKVENKKVIKKAVYLTASEEEGKYFAQSLVTLDENGFIKDKEIVARYNGEYLTVTPKDIDYIDVSSKQMTSIASSAIPFLENTDANRSLMGANMQRQAVPLLKSEAPIVGTGIEASIAASSASNLRAKEEGEVTYVDSEIIEIKHKQKKQIYKLRTFEKSNQGTLISQRPIVNVKDKVKENQVITDGPSFCNGEMALGKNMLVAFSTWNGYNFEDAIIVSERLVKDDDYTSIHIEEKTIEFRKQKLGDDILTNEIPNVSKFSMRHLDGEGVIRIGSEIQAGDVLVGRVSPKGENNPTPEEKLIAAIFSRKQSNTRDTSLKVAYGHAGTVIDVQRLSRENGDKLQDDVSMIIKILIAQKRKIKVGDKMAGRHGNKGVISRVLPIEDMPHLEDGTPIDIMLNPQGVPSRMNIGQVLEMHLGLAGKMLDVKFATPVFDGIKIENINKVLEEAKLPINGKFDLYDPISGRKFDEKVSVGVVYMLKLAHMIDDKMHARSVGPYSLITQQPLGGKSQNGGQRFGEMETWAIEAYGATNILQEILTYKSDNIEGRNKVYNAIVSGSPLPQPGTPESFNVLAYELRGLCMKLSVGINENAREEEHE